MAGPIGRSPPKKQVFCFRRWKFVLVNKKRQSLFCSVVNSPFTGVASPTRQHVVETIQI